MGIWRVLFDPQSFLLCDSETKDETQSGEFRRFSLAVIVNAPTPPEWAKLFKSGVCLSIDLIRKQWEGVVEPTSCTVSLALSACSQRALRLQVGTGWQKGSFVQRHYVQAGHLKQSDLFLALISLGLLQVWCSHSCSSVFYGAPHKHWWQTHR